jgi:prepilin-type N-terminal cleavage/methylation domain-containing protein
MRNPLHARRRAAAVRAAAFTLIEILVVVAIMAVVMTISVPFINTALGGGKGMNRAVKDVQEACRVAREWAILRQTPQELRIRPGGGVFEVGPATREGAGQEGNLNRREQYLRNLAEQQRGAYSPDVQGGEWRMESGSRGGGKNGNSFSITLPQGVFIEAILANGLDMTETESASVIFRPNSTCDELSLVLSRPESNEQRQIWLEVITALTDLETDPLKFRDMNQ